MRDDDSVKALLERLCSLQEQQLTKLSEALDRSAAARERLENIADTLKRAITTWDEAHKAQARRAIGYQISAWLRTILLVSMLAVIAVAIIVAHYLK